MGYDFVMVKKPIEAVGYTPELPDRPDWFRYTSRGMALVFEYMRYSGALEGETPQPDFPERTSGAAANLETILATPSVVGGAVPYWKFTSNSGWLILPEECKIVATRLENLLSVDPDQLKPDDWPASTPFKPFLDGLREWVAFNRLASTHGGYRVR